MTGAPHPDWLTPADLAERMGRPVRWVEDRMRTGEIPSVKVGSKRWFTPGCMVELERRQLHADERPADEWGRLTRRRSA